MVCLQIAEIFMTWLSIYILPIVFGIISWIFWAILEMGRYDFPVSLRNRLSGVLDITLISRPPRGRSGVLINCARRNTLDVSASSNGDFDIKLHICNKANNFTWRFVAVYRATQEEYKADFQHEFNLAKDNPYPILIRVNFNFLRYPHEKRQLLAFSMI
jgi:hypothetical protein